MHTSEPSLGQVICRLHARITKTCLKENSATQAGASAKQIKSTDNCTERQKGPAFFAFTASTPHADAAVPETPGDPRAPHLHLIITSLSSLRPPAPGESKLGERSALYCADWSGVARRRGGAAAQRSAAPEIGGPYFMVVNDRSSSKQTPVSGDASLTPSSGGTLHRTAGWQRRQKHTLRLLLTFC